MLIGVWIWVFNKIGIPKTVLVSETADEKKYETIDPSIETYVILAIAAIVILIVAWSAIFGPPPS